ncbi:ribose-phosphate pyrophosphokinase [Daejeonella oryzae]|uniref:ribose-phosphate pyrophosphokinase n=1 Tax=Daejeonella oryzae TaxID=1122943 RepID=UPI0004120E39|nr:ribose-phosphate pyrophosphokinase [Daejeonella oryzae]
MDYIVLALPGNQFFAEEIAGFLQTNLGKLVISHFPDGETYLRVESSVENKKAIIVCTMDYPDKKIIPLYFLAKTLKSLGANSICLVAPYLAYMRQDKSFKTGEGITSDYFAKLISGFADELITIDPHLHRRNSLSEIYSIPCKVIHASPLISEYIKSHILNPLLIGPDEESEQWVSEIAKNAAAPYLILKKIRLGDRDVQITLPEIKKYKNHTPVIVDDIISTAGTMIQTVRLLRKTGMTAPACIAVHAIFAGNSFDELRKNGAGEIITTNSIAHQSNLIDISHLLARNID